MIIFNPSAVPVAPILLRLLLALSLSGAVAASGGSCATTASADDLAPLRRDVLSEIRSSSSPSYRPSDDVLSAVSDFNGLGPGGGESGPGLSALYLITADRKSVVIR